MKDFTKYLIGGLISVAVIAGILMGVFLGGYFYGKRTNSFKAETVVELESSKFDLKLPGEVEKRIVTKDEVETKIYEIGELSTYCAEYTVSKSVDESRYLLENIAILGTKNTISIECTGNVKIGYNMSEISVRIGEDTIYVSIPEAYVTDNYIIWDSVICEEKNRILNPIEFSQYQELITEIEAEGLAEVETEGIYDKADENFENLIKIFLSEFDNYEIEFM